MPGSGFEFFNQNKTETTTVSDFLDQIQKAYADQKATIDELNKLNISNVQQLGTLKRQQEYELVRDYTQLRLKAVNQINQKEKDELDELNKQRDADNLNLSEAEFKYKYGFEKKLLAKRKKDDKDRLEADAKARTAQAKKEAEEAIKNAKKKQRDEARTLTKKLQEDALGSGKSFSERKEALKQMGTTADGKFNVGRLGLALADALGDLAKQLDNTIDQIGGYKSAIDTRLQGLSRSTGGFFGGGSYWDNISTKITGLAGMSPLIKQSDVANRVKSMVEQGIAFNLEQRAVLDVLKDKIATTFDATNKTLLRLVRVQQQDTTAARLGMESALTAFLNNMYATTEYMTNIASSIKGSLEEAMSLMSGENALSFEYQVQKWLGSLYSTGMSDQAVQSLGGVLGKLAAGQLDAITQGGQGNLVIMAANQAGMSVADLLANGLNAQTTNDLLNSMVDYLAKLYQEAGDSKVIQQQMASIYGLSAADLKAAVNLARSTGIISRNGLSYSGAMDQLYNMANSMYERTSMGEIMKNVWENTKYSMAAGIANNPALYAMYKAAGLLDTVAGGLEFSLPTVMGTGMAAQTFKVSDIMRSGALAGGIISSIGSMITSGGGGGFLGRNILNAAGVGSNSVVTRGTGTGLSTMSGITVSESGSVIGNANSSDLQNQTMTATTDSAKATTAAAVDTSEETKLKDVYSEVVDIYRLLQEVANGNRTIAVDVKNSVKIDGLNSYL